MSVAGDAWLAEMWPVVREYHDPMPSIIPELFSAPRNGSDVCDNQDAQNGPGIAELDAPAGAYPRVTGGLTMLTHPHPPRIEASR